MVQGLGFWRVERVEGLGVSRRKPGQKTIYWIAGMSQDEVARSPFAEKLVAEVGFWGIMVQGLGCSTCSKV